MELERLAEALAPIEVVNPAAVDVRDLAYDTRRVEPGTLFFCVRGAQADGHEFAPEAVAGGAVALVVERPLELPVPQLVVADTRAAMARAAVAFFGDPTAELDVAGVTGTNGKTTTAFLLFAVLAAAGRRPGLLGTIECRVGGERRAVQRTTPEAIDLQRTFREMLDAGDRSCAIEASSHASALGRLEGTRFAALVFTNLSQDHLDFHGTMDAYYASKRRLFDGPPAAVNVGDPCGRRLADELRADGGTLVTFGLADDADIRPEGLELTPAGTRFRADGLEITTRLRGRFNVENVLGTIAAARLLGLDDDAVVRGVESLRGVPGRFEAVDEGQPFTVIVDYAHTPEALENVLASARELAQRPRDLRLRLRRRPRPRQAAADGPGGRDARRPRDRHLRQPAQRGSARDHRRDPRGCAREPTSSRIAPPRSAAAIELAAEGDVVLIAGKGHEQGQELADRKIPFDDREVARDALRRLGVARVIALPVAELAGLGVLETEADEVTGVQVDSRRIAPGDLFVAVGGGAAFVDDATAHGATATLVPDDAHAALARIGGLVRDRSDARFVAITGSMGKTTTKDILAALCRPHARTVAAESSYNNEIGVPLTLCRVEPDTEVCILELAMRGFGQIAELCSFSRPQLGVITSIGPVHLEKVGTIEGVRRAKSELLEALPPGGTAIVPDDFPVSREDLTVIRVGEDVRLEGFEVRGEGAVVPPRSARSRSTSRCATSRRMRSTRSPPTGRSGCRSTARTRAPRRSRSRTGATRSCRFPAAAS